MTNVLLTYTRLVPSVRFCALEPLKFLHDRGQINLTNIASHKVTAKHLNLSDVIVLVRCGEDREVEIAEKCKKAGKKIIYVLDDDLLNVPEETECTVYFNLNSIKNNIKRIMDACDVLWTPNVNILNKYGSFFDKAILINEPFLGDIHKVNDNGDIVKIGFAGSTSHQAFIDNFLTPILVEIKNRNKEKIEIVFFGVKPKCINEIRAKYIPYSEQYSEYCETIKKLNLDIGLAPLEESEFAKCKYFNKYIEYSSYGIAGIYSNVEPYTFAIKNGINGILADNDTKSWVAALEKLIEDKILRKSISRNAQNELVEKYNIDIITKKLVKETPFLCKHKAEKRIKYRRKSFVWSKIKINMEAYGVVLFPFMIIKKAVKKLLS